MRAHVGKWTCWAGPCHILVILICDDGCAFEFWLYVDAEVGRLLGSFTLRDAVVLGGSLCLTSTLVCSVSLWGIYCGVVVCLKISAKLMITCNFLDHMDAHGAVGAGFLIASIKSSAILVDDSWLDTPGILLWSGKNNTVSVMRLDLVFKRILYCICSVPWMVPDTIPITHVVTNIFVALIYRVLLP